MLGLDVHGGEHGTGAHPAQQPDARCAAAGADLDDSAGADSSGDETDSCTSKRAHRRRAANFGCVPPGADQRLVLR